MFSHFTIGNVESASKTQPAVGLGRSARRSPMAAVFTVLLSIGSITASPGAAAEDDDLIWARGMGGIAGNVARGIAVDEFGNVFTTGVFQLTADFDPGPGTLNLTASGGLEVFVSKLDMNGNALWARAMGGPGSDRGIAIAVDDSGNVFTTGHFEGTADFDPGIGEFNLTSEGDFDVFVSKLDENGDFVWARSIGGIGEDFGEAIATDELGNVYIAGFFNDTVDFDPGPGVFNLTSEGGADLFILKLDANGEFMWARAIGGPFTDLAKGIAVDGFGNVHVTGYFEDTVDFDPGPGISELTAVAARDIFVLKLDTNGDFVWARAMGGLANNEAWAIAVDGAGNVYTTGSFGGTVEFDPGAGTFELTAVGTGDIFVSKLDTNGDLVWARAMGGSDFDRGNSIALDGEGNIYTTGRFQGLADFDPGVDTFELSASGFSDVFVSKLDENGIFVWARAMGGSGENIGYSIAVDEAGRSYVAGSFEETADFDPGPSTFELVSEGMSDIFVTKLGKSVEVIVSGAILDATTLLPVTCAVVELTSSDESVRIGAVADELGRYFFEPLPEDTYAVRVMAPGYQRLAPAPVVIVGEDSISINYFLLPSSATNTVSGQLTEEGSNFPLVGALVELIIDEEVVDDTLTCADGRYELLIPLPASKQDLVDIELAFSLENYEAESISDTVDPAVGLVVNEVLARSLTGLGSIFGVVTGKSGASVTPLQGASVTLRGPFNVTSQTDIDGTYQFATLLDGTYTVTASKNGFASKSLQRVLAPGEVREASFELESLEPPEPPVEPVPGDVTGTGVVNATDVQVVINAVLRLAIDPTHNPDVNGDGVVNALDVQFVINIVLGINIG